jgi:FkbM family methyltransferase
MKLFVEVGSCDFDTCLPLAKNGWAGIMVEPVKELADNMKEQSKDYPNVVVENLVVSDYNGEIDFHVATGDEETWTRGISSVASDNHKGMRMFEISDGANKKFLKDTRKLPCLTLDALLEKHDIKQIDFLKIDTEGHETNIIEAYSWKVKPTMIKLEHSHIDDVNMKLILEGQGYIVWTERSDIYAVR